MNFLYLFKFIVTNESGCEWAGPQCYNITQLCGNQQAGNVLPNTS